MKKIFFSLFWVCVIALGISQIPTPDSPKSPRPLPPAKSKALPSFNMVTLYLKNGGTISGELLRESDRGVAILWKGGEVEFAPGEIERVQKGEVHAEKEGFLFPEEIPEVWPYKNDVVIHLQNQQVLDEKIGGVQGERIILRRELEEGGTIEQEIGMSEIEYLSFKPIQNEKSRRIESSLRTQFPKMKWVREGSFTLVTDSYATWVNEYRKTIRELGTDFYLNFFQLLKNRSPLVAHYIVIFDEWGDFMMYAATDGLPGWAVAGYFSPKSETLFLFNTLGDTFSKLIEEAIVGRTGRIMDSATGVVKSQVDKRYHVFIEGQIDEVRKKFSAAHSIIRGQFREETVNVLRHELTHELFHNWGLQSVVVSKVEGSQEEEAKKKRDFLESSDIQKKRELLLELAQMRGSGKPMQVEASNSWFVEGLAAYMEATPVGEINKRWLYLFQEAKREKALFPIEHLTVYKMGSFPGITFKSMQYAYAQSWAFVHFLMNRYPAQFMSYLERLSREKPKENEDIQWLLQALGKELRGVEGEFLDYMNQFPELEDPFLEHFDTMRSVFEG